MKRILILIIGLFGVAYGQSSPTSAKTRFVNGIYLGTKLDSYFAAADSNAVYWRADSVLRAKYKGTARSIAFVGDPASGYVLYTDTAAMLAPFIQYSDTTGLFSQVVRTFGTQTIGGNKTFTNDIFASTARIGIGAGGNASNAVLGYNVFTANTTGTKNTAMGENSLSSNVSATDNTALGWYSLDAATGSGNTGIGSGALGTNTSGSNNTALGFGAGEYVTGTNPNSTGTNSIYIGFNTKASANGETNQTVIGHNATGNGSNTVTIGNSSVTNNYFTGNIRGGAFIKSGGTSSQFLKADGSVDGTSYATAASISGTTNYISKFTGSGSIGNSIAFESVGRITFESTNISPLLVNGTATNGGFLTIQKGGVDLGFFGSSESISASANKFDISARTGKGLALYTNASSTAAIDISTSNAVTLTGALNGTSLSMSGGGTFGGNVGIGTTSPSSISGYTVLSLNNATNGGMLDLKSNGTSLGFIYAFDNSINIGSNGTAPINFLTASGNPRGQWASDGTFLINTTTPDGTNKLIVNGGVKVSGTNDLTVGGIYRDYQGEALMWTNTSAVTQIGSGGASVGRELQFLAGNATRLTIATTGAATFSSSVTATGFFESSDLRLKNIVKRDGDVVYFNWKNGQDKNLHIGYIAQEVQKTNPDQVKADEKGMLSVNYTEVLVQKVRELEKQIAELQNRIK